MSPRPLVGVCVLACLIPPPARAESGWIEWQAWGRVEQGDARALPAAATLESPPLRWNRVPDFESARDLMENFAVRMRGVFSPPMDGEYVFALETQGAAVLRLAREDGEGEVVELAYARDGTASSRPVALEASRRYRLEAIHRGAEGPDSLRVGWKRPDGVAEMPLPARHFSTVSDGGQILAFNQRRAYVEPYTRSYNTALNLSRDRHAPKTNEHLTRETVYAAAAMLTDGRPEQVEEAVRALRKVLPLQNSRDGTFDFGNWPKFVERPTNFNAQNIGGFIGEELIIILERHREKLPADLVGDLETALRRAALRGVRYDPPVTATNIVTKAVTVALLADQMLDIPAAREWGVRRLGELHAHTQAVGLPTEYNSPTYNSVALKALGLLRTSLKDEELRPLVEDLYLATWRELAFNYNPHLQLWTGPAARRYEDVFSPGALLQAASGNRLFFGEHSHAEVAQELPAVFAEAFEPSGRSLTRSFTVLAAQAASRIEDQQSPVPLTATVHHTPAFSIGSFNRADLWDQRRPIIAYWGRRDAPGFFRVTSPSGKAGLLAAQLNSVQVGGAVASAVSFVTDAGWGANPYDLHSAPRTGPHIVSDVRIRFVTGGAAGQGGFKPPGSLKAPVRLEVPGGRLELRVLEARFGSARPRWELAPQGHLDLVLHSGEPVDLARVDVAAAAFTVTLGAAGESGPRASATITDSLLRVELGERSVSVPTRPTTYAELQNALSFSPAPPASASEPATPIQNP